ncbi:MAG: restriction endonuclease subunit S [Acinetobacter sp.]|uniref:restriction endonuclease subunit S n=1 Tax=Acinetobacter sp. TaxID=472 RepID=UPI0026E0A52A|nr:restriction endonuclease subunit S [Acinetobacter sp.]MDO5543883.1 restriction endonuclease subunit S [Acinetobacter sp.]
MSVPKLRFKEFTPEYNEYELKTLLKSYRLGGNYSNSESKTNYPLIKMGNLNRGSINLSKIEYISSDEIIDDQDQIQLGDLFFNTRNTLDLVGKVAIWRNELPVAYYNSNLMRLEFENNFYMNFLLNTEKSLEKLKAIASGTTSVAAIYTKDLLKVKVKIPFVDEQTKIASFLCAVDEKISQLTQKHELLSQYKQGMMQKLFSQQIRFKADDGSEFGEWEINIIRDVFTNKSKNFNPQNEGNLPCIELEHLSQNTGKILGTIESCEQQSTKNLFEKNSVLFGKLRPYLRKFAKPKFKGVCSSEIWVLTGIKVSNDYLFQYIQSEQFSELTNIQSGSKMPRADWGVISEAEIEYPCLAEQTKIANFLSAIDQKIEVVAQQIEQAKTWKKGLLQQMFV